MGDDVASHWTFKRAVNLNHGSFGGTPDVIRQLKNKFDNDLDQDRQQFFWLDAFEPHERARKAVADFVGAPHDDLVLVDHATEAVNTILKSLSFAPGNEILITSHLYSPYQDLLKEFCRRNGMRLVVAQISHTVSAPDEVADAVIFTATDKTRLAIIEHISSPAALVFPVKDIVKGLAAKGIDTFVDGAHAIGQIPLDMKEIGAAYYTSNNHKWLCAPLQSAFLYVRPDKQDNIIPAIGSKGATEDHSFVERFHWQGTKSLAARLCLPEVIDYMAGLHPDGWPGIYKRNHDLALAARDILCDKLDIEASCPPEMIGSMFALPLGDLEFRDTGQDNYAHQHTRLYNMMMGRYGYGVYSFPFDGKEYLLRISSHLYNNLPDYERLADDLLAILPEIRKN